jgi:hypothetical protein
VNTELAKTPIDQWRTYLRWHMLRAASDALPKPFVEEKFNFYGKYLSGATEMKPRWKRCAEDTDNLLGDALGHAYVEKYFPPEAKARMQDMVKNILLAMHDTIQGLDWMTPDTKAKALALTATNSAGSSTVTKSSYIKVTDPVKPVAAFSASPRSGTKPLKVQFTDSSTGLPTSWSWDFGDGTTSTTHNPLHTYIKKGKLTVKLTVKNAAGSSTKTMTNYIIVK